MIMRFSSHSLGGLAFGGLAAVGLLTLLPFAAHAQSGALGTPGTNGNLGATLSGSFTLSDPSVSFTGGAGGVGGNGGNAGPAIGRGGNGGNGGNGGGGLIATGDNANITITGGTFTGGAGGDGGLAGQSISPYRISGGGYGGNGGDAFAVTGAGTNITILGGTFNGGRGGSTPFPQDYGGGGNAGRDFSTSAGETASVYGGNFGFNYGGHGGYGSLQNGAISYAFALDGSNVTVYGAFTSPYINSYTNPAFVTLTDSYGYFYGVLANNSEPAQNYYYSIVNGGTLTLAAIPRPPVPEASTTVSLGLLLALGLGGLAIAAKRKKTMGKASA